MFHPQFARRCVFALLAVLLCGVFGHAQMVAGSKIPGFADTFGLNAAQKSFPFKAEVINSSAPGNILWPGDQLTLTVQLTNTTAQPLPAKGKLAVIDYATKGQPGDIWVPQMYKIADAGEAPVDTALPANGFVNVTITPNIPEKFGAYALVIDLGDAGRQFVTTCVRTFAADPKKIQYPGLSLDYISTDVLKRLGIRAVRFGVGYKTTTDKDFADWFAGVGKQLQELHDANITVLFMAGGGNFYGDTQPMGRPRPWLDDTGKMLDTKFDLAWVPQYDDDFQKYVKLFAATYGWPKGPITAFSLWNEPWNGISISGWGADDQRYREIYTRMAQGVEQARKEDGADVLVGGCDSSSNAMDKLFADGRNEFLNRFDFLSVHYQGMDSHAVVKQWVDRTGPNGRVKIWDTESWVANTDDRVAAVVAANRASGYDRAMGVYGGNVADLYDVNMRSDDGKAKRLKMTRAWSVAASVGAATHFIGERPFKEVLFKNGLPWVMLFGGMPGADGAANPEDGTAVVVGDLGEEFGPEMFLFRTARGLKEMRHKEALKAQLAALPADAPAADRAALEKSLRAPEILGDAAMMLNDGGGKFSLYDFYGNPVPAKDGKIMVPLDGRGFFLRANGEKGAFAQLVEAMRSARIEGIEPVAPVCHDLTEPIDKHPTLRLALTNVLNRPVQGTLKVTLGELTLDYPATVSLNGNETREVPVKVTAGAAVPANIYHLTLGFDAGADGKTTFEEDMHVNVIAKRTITVDGKLDDWEGVLPQTITTQDSAGPTMQEFAWRPFMKYDDSVKKGLATGYLAYDNDNFYFAAKIADTTPDAGMPRFATRDDSAYFYPEKTYIVYKDGPNKHDEMWAKSITDVRVLQKAADDAKDRVAAWWRPERAKGSSDNACYMSFDITPADKNAHQLALYLLDFDRRYRFGKVQLVDPDTAEVLDERTVSDFGDGKYLVWTIRRSVTVRVWTLNNTLPVALCGVFVDPATAAVQPAVHFDRVDSLTQGNWKGVYGKEGYSIAGDTQKWGDAVKFILPENIAPRMDYTWPEGIRRYSYRKNPELPAGNMPNHDNVQIAFNVLPAEKKPWYPCPPGTMPGFTWYYDTDYEYALNTVAAQYGGGTEIWRLRYPNMPHKHFYPREPKSPQDGPAQGGKLVTLHDGNTRIVECALPWAEIPDVKKALDAGKTIKFSFRVNDNAGIGCLELAKNRSVAKRNGSFGVDWAEHWANEVEFGYEH